MESIKQNLKPKKLCLCRALKPATVLCRLFGLFPLVTDHVNGYCIFKKSYLWLTYSIIRLITLLIQLVFTTDLFNIFNISKGKSLHVLLSSINDIIYGLYIALLTFFSIIRYPKFAKALNNLVPILREGLLCESALKTIQKIQYGFLFIIMVVFLIQFAAFAWLHYSTQFISNLNINTFLNRFTQNITFIFYVVFMCLCSIFMGIFGCYEKLLANCLKYNPVHPIKGIDESNNIKEFLFVLYYKLCNEGHFPSNKILAFTPPEQIEFLRCLHEEISLVLYEINCCLNPQFLCHTVIELTVLIVHWYAVIIYIAYDFSTPIAKAIHFLNCVFVIFHTIGLFMFLKNFQHLHNMIHGLTNYLLEYSTRISLVEEYQQVRLFVEKINIHRPFTASGVFTLDLSIAGPICANILTYVLVALQFEVAKT